MKRILSILALLLCIVTMHGQNRQKNQQDTKGDYEFILPQKAYLNMEYPKSAVFDNGVQTYRSLS